MTKFMAILELAAIIAVLSPMTGHAQQHHRALVSARSHFKIDKLSTRKAGAYTYVDGEITSNAKKETRTVWITVRWFDKDGLVVDHYTTHVPDLAPGETVRFSAHFTKKPPEAVRYDAYVNSVEED